MTIPSYERSFASHEKAKYWSKKNGCVNSKDVYKSSHTKYWFDCDKCKHCFKKALNSVVSGRWCPYCTNQQLCGNDCSYCFNKSFASHEKAVYWSKKNGYVKPREIFKCSAKMYWFDCDKCNHSFEASLSNITKKTNPGWCSYCASKEICNDEKCKKCYNKSFASHEKAKYWSDQNKAVTPRNVFKSSDKQYWFDCDKCQHTFGSILSSIVAGNWCSYCSSTQLCENQACTSCENKSFASHEKAKYWSKTENGDVKPREIFKNSGNKFWFDCDKCFHTFDCTPKSIVAGNWCSYCSSKRLCKNLECDLCLNKSFASHEKTKYWSKTENGDVKPREIFKNSGNKFWFDCDKCKHSFNSGLNNIVNGTWCPHCVNKTEAKLYDAIKEMYPSIICQFKQEWCKNIKCLPFDVCIPEHNIIIELDGRQHFEQVSNWNTPEETFENDLFKEKCANENGYSIIRILQKDVFSDKYDWLSKLQTEIENIIKDDTIIHNIYMCENGEYDKFIIE